MHMADPIFSPDGKWTWSGSEWIPASPKETLEEKIIDTSFVDEMLGDMARDTEIGKMVSDLEGSLDNLCIFLDSIDSDEKYQQNPTSEHFHQNELKVKAIFDKIGQSENQGIDLHKTVENICIIFQNTLPKLEFKQPRHQMPLHHPFIARNISEFLYRCGYAFHLYSMKTVDKITGGHKPGIISHTIALIAVEDARRFYYAFHKANYVNPMGGPSSDEIYNQVKPWMQSRMMSCARDADKAYDNGLLSLYCELQIYRFEIPTYFNVPWHTEDICEMGDGSHNLKQLIDDVETVNHFLLDSSKMVAMSVQFRRQLLHRCRKVRSFFQIHYGMFQNETDWSSAEMKAVFRATMSGDRFDQFYLADLGTNETIGGFGSPF
jgi:hypothetical protein